MALHVGRRVTEASHVRADERSESDPADHREGGGVVVAGAHRPGETGPAGAGGQRDAPGDGGGPGHDQQPSPRQHPGRPRPARRDRERDGDGKDEAPAGTRPPVGEERRREEREVRATALERRPPRRGAGEGDGHRDQGPRDRRSPGSHQRWRRRRTRDRGGTTGLARHGATLAGRGGSTEVCRRRTRSMSATALAVPRTVPVTFERPSRGA